MALFEPYRVLYNRFVDDTYRYFCLRTQHTWLLPFDVHCCRSHPTETCCWRLGALTAFVFISCQTVRFNSLILCYVVSVAEVCACPSSSFLYLPRFASIIICKMKSEKTAVQLRQSTWADNVRQCLGVSTGAQVQLCNEGVIYVAGHPLLNRRCTRLPGCIRLRNDLYCVGWGVKLYSLTHSSVMYAGVRMSAKRSVLVLRTH